MRYALTVLILIISLSSCNQPEKPSVDNEIDYGPSIEGKAEYLESPYVTAGNRVYMVGHQIGTFPELGWHIKNEMGGIWDHPIKLMDGFQIDLNWSEDSVSLDQTKSFVNYSWGNKHIFDLDNRNIEIERWQFVPDDKEGIAVQLVIKNRSETEQEFNLRFTGHTDLRPTWLGERSNMIDHSDTSEYLEDVDGWMAKDSLNPWFSFFGADIQSVGHSLITSDYGGKGISNTLSYSISLAGKEIKTVNFVVAGSYHSGEAALGTYKDIQSNLETYRDNKQSRYKQLALNSKLTIPDKKLEQTFEWLKYNSDWLIRTVPEIGSGITAGIPDYPWWFGVDSEYALKGYMAIGQTEAVYNTISLLDSLSEVTNGNGRIIHETSTNGAVFNEGNINETPQFASLIWEIYKWNGDIEFLKKYYPTVKKGLDWLMKEKDTDNNLFPDGFGMMEIHGLNSEMIDVAAYTQRAFDDASKMATALGENQLASSYQKTASDIKEKINKDFWSEEFNSYADFIGTDEQALHLIEDAIVRADTLDKPWAVTELEQTKSSILANPSDEPRPFVLHHNWVVNTPMEMNIADKDKALRALETAEAFVNPFGVFVTGIDRDESAGSDDGSFKGSEIFSYTGAVMTLPTGVQAVAENNYGRPNKALNYLQRMARTFSYALPGSMYEVSPDYGMITQAWNIYSFAVPIVNQFFGINPKAYDETVVIRPQMPDEWDEASLENVLIADNSISVFYTKQEDQIVLRVEQNNSDWEVELVLPEIYEEVRYEVEESTSQTEMENGFFRIKSKATFNKLVLKRKP